MTSWKGQLDLMIVSSQLLNIYFVYLFTLQCMVDVVKEYIIGGTHVDTMRNWLSILDDHLLPCPICNTACKDCL